MMMQRVVVVARRSPTWVLQGNSIITRRTTRPLLAAVVFRETRTTTTTTTTASKQVGTLQDPKHRSAAVAAAIVASLATGFAIGRYSASPDPHSHNRHTLPDGLPRACCEEPHELTDAQTKLPARLRSIVGKDNVLDGRVASTSTLPFLRGARPSEIAHSALCIVTPRKLHDVQRVVQAALDADCVIVPQGQNTGLTGGSVPRPTNRPVVLLSLKHLAALFPIDNGKRIVCFAGVGLASLQQFLTQYFPDRESHSVLGSTFLNPTTAAGLALGSGGTQCCRKGPAYTERALCLKIATNKWKERVVQVVNTLDIKGMEDPSPELVATGRARAVMDSVAYRLDTWGRWTTEGKERDMRYSTPGCTRRASDDTYAARLCDTNDTTVVSRYNADPTGPDHCRSEGKVIVLASVHDTFPKPQATKTFWIGFDSFETALEFRTTVALANAHDMPIAMEYMDRDAFDVTDQAGRVLGQTIQCVGTASPIIRALWNVKLWVEALPLEQAPVLVDSFLYTINHLFPAVLPREIMDIAKSRDHHVALTVGEFGDGTLQRIVDRMQAFTTAKGPDKVVVYECDSERTAHAVTAFRFVAAPAFRTYCVGHGLQGYSVDYALPKQAGTAPPLSAKAEPPQEPLKRMRYSHFACNVVHEDLAYGPEVDMAAAKHAFKTAIATHSHGKLPAEHGHGTEYVAPEETQSRWKKMDPLNVLNPGIGGLSSKFRYEQE